MCKDKNRLNDFDSLLELLFNAVKRRELFCEQCGMQIFETDDFTVNSSGVWCSKLSCKIKSLGLLKLGER